MYVALSLCADRVRACTCSCAGWCGTHSYACRNSAPLAHECAYMCTWVSVNEWIAWCVWRAGSVQCGTGAGACVRAHAEIPTLYWLGMRERGGEWRGSVSAKHGHISSCPHLPSTSKWFKWFAHGLQLVQMVQIGTGTIQKCEGAKERRSEGATARRSDGATAPPEGVEGLDLEEHRGQQLFITAITAHEHGGACRVR